MKLRHYIAVVLILLIILGAHFVKHAFAQEAVLPNAFQVRSPEEKLHALALTRFHFITLKQFHSALFSFSEDRKVLRETEAQVLNAGLNAFLTKPGRENLLLEALRQNKSVQLKFFIPRVGTDYEMVPHPTKPLLYRLEPIQKGVPAVVEIKPLLDQPIAFKITLKRGEERFSYDVDWAGHITRIS